MASASAVTDLPFFVASRGRVSVRTPATRREPPASGRSRARVATAGTVAGTRSRWAGRTVSNTPFAHAHRLRQRAEGRRQRDDRAARLLDRRRGRGCRSGCRRGGSGRSTASGRRRRTARPRRRRHGRRDVACAVRSSAGQEHDDVGLDRIGVLELVHEEPAVLLLERASDVRRSAQQARGALQQVAVVERERLEPAATRECASFDEQRNRQPIEVLPPLLQERDDDAVSKVLGDAKDLVLDAALLGRVRVPALLNDI